MPDIEIPFGEWLPDQADFENPGLVEAKNVIPTSKGYAPARGAGTSRASVSGTPNFAEYFVSASYGRPLVLVRNGSTLGIYDRDASLGWTLLASQAVTGGGETNTSVTRFDDTLIISANSAAYQLNLASPAGGFSTLTLPTSGPSVVEVVNKFLLVADVSESRFYYSAFNDFDDFTADLRTQAGSTPLDTPELGPITEIIGGRTPLLFQKNGITRLEYVRPPTVWADRLISSEFGCIAPNAAVTYGDITYFLSPQGFCATDGASVVRIGDGKVDRWLFEERDSLNTGRNLNSVFASVDFENQNVLWHINSGEVVVVYSIRTDSFSYIEDDSNIGLFFSLYQDNTEPPTLHLLNSTDITESEGGDALAAEMTPGHQALVKGTRTSVNGFEPVYTGSGATCAASSKQTINGDATVTAYVSQTDTGLCPVRADGRALAPSVRFPAAASWDEFKGVIAKVDTSGAR